MPLIQPSALSLSLCLMWGSIYSNMIIWCQSLRAFEDGMYANQDGKYEMKFSNHAKASSGWTRRHSHRLRVQMLTFATRAVEQWQLGYLNSAAFLGAIKNHLGIFKWAQGSLRNVPLVQMGWKVFQKRSGVVTPFMFFYGSVGHISILCRLVWRHLKRWKIGACSRTLFLWTLNITSVEDLGLLPNRTLQVRTRTGELWEEVLVMLFFNVLG